MAANFAKLRKLFPAEWSTRLLTVKEIQDAGVTGFVVEARIAIGSKEQFGEWLKRHEKLARVSYKLLKNYPTAGKYVVYKAEYVCTPFPGSRKLGNDKTVKRGNCPSKLLVRIKAIPTKFKNRKLNGMRFPCTIVLYHQHNHSVDTIAFNPKIQHNDVIEDVRRKFREMFVGGYSLTMALNTHQSDLLEEYADEYDDILNDRFMCPDMEWIAKFHGDFHQTYGEFSTEKVLSNLQSVVAKLNSGEGKAKLQVINEDIIIVICTPIMQRAHSLKSAGEIVFVDSSGFMERCKCYVYVFMAYSCAEGLPLGVMITTSDTEEILTSALKLFVEILPEKAFGQNGKSGPEMFLTANNDSEQESIKTVFPQSNLLLCSFHMLHCLWRWLWDQENNVDEADRCTLFSLAFNIMKTTTAQEFTSCFAFTLTNEVVTKYPQFQAYFQELSGMSARWAVCFKNEILDKDKEISAIEMASHILRDKIFLTRAYNILQLFEFYVEDMEAYYRQKITHCISDTLEAFLQSTYKIEMRMIDDLEVNALPTGQYRVLNSKSSRAYFVDMNVGVCSCPLGLIGTRCKHQYALAVLKNIEFSAGVPDDETIKKELYWIATNSLDVPVFNTWDGGSSDSDTAMDIQNYDEDDSMDADFKLMTKPSKKTIEKESILALRYESQNILTKMVEHILEHFEESPSEFHTAITVAASNYQKLTATKDILMALKNFGRPDHSNAIHIQPKFVETQKRTKADKNTLPQLSNLPLQPQNVIFQAGSLLQTSNIPVQPTNVLVQTSGIPVQPNVTVQPSSFPLPPTSVLTANNNVVLLPYNLQLLPSNVAPSSNVLILPDNCQVVPSSTSTPTNVKPVNNVDRQNVKILPKPSGESDANVRIVNEEPKQISPVPPTTTEQSQVSSDLAPKELSQQAVEQEVPNDAGKRLPDMPLLTDSVESTNIQMSSDAVGEERISSPELPRSEPIKLDDNIQVVPDGISEDQPTDICDSSVVAEQETSDILVLPDHGEQPSDVHMLHVADENPAMLPENIEGQSNIQVIQDNVEQQLATIQELSESLEQPTNINVLSEGMA